MNKSTFEFFPNAPSADDIDWAYETYKRLRAFGKYPKAWMKKKEYERIKKKLLNK